MDIWQANKLLLFILFVIPGFVALKAYELLVPRQARDSSQQIIDAIAYSCINYALLFWPIYEIEAHDLRSRQPNAYVAFYVFVVLVAPIIWALAFRKMRESQLFQTALPHPTGRPWDYVFSQRQPYWVIATLKDGTRVGGRYDSRSFASSAPNIEQIYLEEAWLINTDGGFERPRSDSAGILVLASEIATVELFKVNQVDQHGKQSPHGTNGSHDEGLAASPTEASSGH